MPLWRDIIRFLRCITRIHLTPPQRDFVIRFVTKDVPWDNLVAMATMQDIDGFLYYHLKTQNLLAFLSESALRQLEENFYRTCQRNRAILNEAGSLSLRCEQAGIPVIALQGLPLIQTIYPEPGLRRLGDIDVMVQSRHKRIFKNVLVHAGYTAPYPFYEDLLYKNNILIDVHTHVLNLERVRTRRYLFPEDLTKMWEKATPMFDGQNGQNGLMLLDPYDNFVALTAHALKHSYSRQIWLADLNECLLKWADNTGGWKKMVECARFWRQERVVLYSLVLVEKTFDLNVPHWVMRQLGINRLGMLERHLIRLRMRGFSSSILCHFLWLMNIKGAGERLKFIKETVFPEKKIMSQIYGRSPRDVGSAVYPKRLGAAFIRLLEDLYRALRLSFRPHRD